MLNTLRFVQGAIAKKDFVPALTHFRIKDGRITGFNGRLALSSPIDLDLDVTPQATTLVKAIGQCQGTVQIHLTPKGRLAVKSGSFRVYIDCLENAQFPEIEPEGTVIPAPEGLLQAMKVMVPFIGEDASRPWANGLLFRGPSVYATNNIYFVEYWLGMGMPVEVNVPKSTVQEILRIGEDPTSLQVETNSLTFFYEGDRWLRTQLFTDEWPDLSDMFERHSTDPSAIPSGLFEGAKTLLPFIQSDRGLYLLQDRIATHPDSGVGAEVEMEGLPDKDMRFNVDQLLLMEKLADESALSAYPNPCIFYGDRIRGLLAGMTL